MGVPMSGHSYQWYETDMIHPYGNASALLTGRFPSNWKYGLQFLRSNIVTKHKNKTLFSQVGHGSDGKIIGPYVPFEHGDSKGDGVDLGELKLGKTIRYKTYAKSSTCRNDNNNNSLGWNSIDLTAERPNCRGYNIQELELGWDDYFVAQCRAKLKKKYVSYSLDGQQGLTVELDKKAFKKCSQPVPTPVSLSAADLTPLLDDRRYLTRGTVYKKMDLGKPIASLKGSFLNPSPDNRWVVLHGEVTAEFEDGSSAIYNFDRGLILSWNYSNNDPDNPIVYAGMTNHDYLAETGRLPQNPAAFNKSVFVITAVDQNYGYVVRQEGSKVQIGRNTRLEGSNFTLRPVNFITGNDVATAELDGIVTEMDLDTGWVRSGEYRQVAEAGEVAKHGKWVEKDPAKGLYAEYTYDGGVLNGPYSRTLMAGNTLILKEEGSYLEGQPAGYWETYRFAQADGTHSKEITIYSPDVRSGGFQQAAVKQTSVINGGGTQPFADCREIKLSLEGKSADFSNAATARFSCLDRFSGEWASSSIPAPSGNRNLMPFDAALTMGDQGIEGTGYALRQSDLVFVQYQWTGGKLANVFGYPVQAPWSGKLPTPLYTGPVNPDGIPHGRGITQLIDGVDYQPSYYNLGDYQRPRLSQSQVGFILAENGQLLDMQEYQTFQNMVRHNQQIQFANRREGERIAQERRQLAQLEADQLKAQEEAEEAQRQFEREQSRAQRRAKQQQKNAQKFAQQQALYNAITNGMSGNSTSGASQAQRDLDRMRAQNNRDVQNYQNRLNELRNQQSSARTQQPSQRQPQRQQTTRSQPTYTPPPQSAQPVQRGPSQADLERYNQQLQQSASSGAPAQLPNRNQPAAPSNASAAPSASKRCNIPGSPAFGAKDDCGNGRWLDNTSVMPPGTAEGDEHCVQTSTPIGVNAIEVRLCGRGGATYYQIYNRTPYEAQVCFEYIGGTMSSAATNLCNLSLQPGWNSKVYESRLDPLQGGLDRFTFTKIFFLDGQEDNRPAQ